MKLKTCLCFLILLGSVSIVYAKTDYKKDTIYYLVDTVHVPVNDRIITIEVAPAPQKFYTINCPCLDEGSKPVFRCNILKQTSVNNRIFKLMKFTSLTALIEIARKNDDEHFDDKYIVYFIEPLGKRYTMNRAFFLGEKVIKTDSPEKK